MGDDAGSASPARCPERTARPTRRAGRRPRLHRPAPGSRRRAWSTPPDGTHLKAIEPLNGWVPVGRTSPSSSTSRRPPTRTVLTDFAPDPLGDVLTAPRDPLYRLGRRTCRLRGRPEVGRCWQDLEVLDRLAAELDAGDARRCEILRALERALDAIDLDDVAGTAAARPRRAGRRAGRAGERQRPPDLAPSGTRTSTRRGCGRCGRPSARCARTFSNVARPDGRRPGAASSPARRPSSTPGCKEHYPELFDRIKAAVAAGRFVPVGGMWVESDTNMPGGEAMARQFVHGKRFFLRRVRRRAATRCGCPTRSATPPRCRRSSRLAGCRWFLTQKISWNETNRFPHHTFWWEGIDGTRVFTHFPPVDTYNSELSGAELAHARAQLRGEGRGHHVAGAVRLRRRRRRADPGDARRGAPDRATSRARRRVRDRAPGGVLRRGARRSTPTRRCGRASCTWSSTAAPTPRRRGPSRATGAASTCCARPSCGAATAAVRAGARLPVRRRCDRLWKTVLLQQFHDILPGSLDRLGAPRGRARTTPRIAAELEELIGTRARPRCAGATATAPIDVQRRARTPGDGVPALGAAAPRRPAERRRHRCATADGSRAGQRRCCGSSVDARGLVTSVVDLAAGREVAAAGRAANLLQLHPDTPNEWDAWDIDALLPRHGRATSTESTSSRSRTSDARRVRVVRSVRRVHGRRRRSRWRRAPAGSTSTTDVDWHEREKLLKLAFPLDVHADRVGVRDPVRPRVPADAHEHLLGRGPVRDLRAPLGARRRAGLRRRGGQRLHLRPRRHPARAAPAAARTTTVRLSLLRAPRFPDPDADQGEHRLRYALRARRRRSRDAVARGLPAQPAAAPVVGSAVAPLVGVDGTASSRRSSSPRTGRATWSCGSTSRSAPAPVRVTATFEHTSVTETDLLERPCEPVALDGDRLRLRPFRRPG